MESVKSEQVVCWSCRNQNRSSTKFCRWCGKELRKKIVKTRLDREKIIDDYLVSFERKKGSVPTPEQARQTFEKIYANPAISSTKMAELLSGELGTTIKPSQLRKYSSKKTPRPVPVYMGVACQSLLEKGIVEAVEPDNEKIKSKEQEKKEREEKREARIKRYLKKFEKERGQVPEPDQSRYSFEQLYLQPVITSKRLAELLSGELGIEVKPSHLRKYSSSKERRKVPGYIGAACQSLVDKRVISREYNRRYQREEEKEWIAKELHELFETGVPYPYMSALLRKMFGANIEPRMLGHFARGTMCISKPLVYPLIQVIKELRRLYPAIPDLQICQEQVKELLSFGSSKRQLAVELQRLSPYCARMSLNGVVKVLNKAESGKRTKRPMDFRFRLVIWAQHKRVVSRYKERSEKILETLPRMMIKLTQELKQSYRLNVDVYRSLLNKEEYYLLAAIVLGCKYIQETVYWESKSKLQAPIGERSIVAYCKAKEWNISRKQIGHLIKKLEELDLLRKGWLTEKGLDLVKIGRYEDYCDISIIHLTRIRVLTPLEVEEFLVYLKAQKCASQIEVELLYDLTRGSFYPNANLLAKLGLITKNKYGELFITSLGEKIISSSDFNPIKLIEKIENIKEKRKYQILYSNQLKSELMVSVALESLKRLYPDFKVTSTLEKQWGVKGPDMLATFTDQNLTFPVMVEMKGVEKNSVFWRRDREILTIIRLLHGLHKESKQLPHHTIYVVSAEPSTMTFQKTPMSKKNKVLFEDSELCYTLNTRSSIHFTRIGIEISETGIFPVMRGEKELQEESSRNEKWIEIRIIDGYLLKDILSDSEWAMKVIEILHLPYPEVHKLYSNQPIGTVIEAHVPKKYMKIGYITA
ncbi:MAG: hypothetical protein ACXAEU_05285 [Candidatus Hodarchaeales archaeon]|jgi:hypothetical protein